MFRELITDYHVDGIEMDWAAAPGGMPAPLRADQLEEFGPVLTDWVAELCSSPLRTWGGVHITQP